MHTITKDIIAALPLDQQRALLDDLRFRLDRKTASERVLATRNEWSSLESDVWQALTRELHARLHIETPPLNIFVNSFGAARYRSVVAGLDAYVASACGEPLSRTHKVVVIRTIISCLVDRLCAREIPVSASSVLASVGQTGQAVDAAFPGYAAARLLHRLVPLVTSVA